MATSGKRAGRRRSQGRAPARTRRSTVRRKPATRRHAGSRRKPVARRRAPRSWKRTLAALLAAAAATALVIVLVVNALTYDNMASKYAACERWRDTVTQACTRTGLGAQWDDAVLAMMVVESGGDIGVSSVTGAKSDLMQAAEGKYGSIVTSGSEKYGLAAGTPEASIYAGTLEFKQNLKLWKAYLGGIEPDEGEKIQLVVQGYNFGADGWFEWCRANGVRSYTVDVAQRYSDTEMPAGAKGTPTHAQKWLEAYQAIRAETTR